MLAGAQEEIVDEEADPSQEGVLPEKEGEVQEENKVTKTISEQETQDSSFDLSQIGSIEETEIVSATNPEDSPEAPSPRHPHPPISGSWINKLQYRNADTDARDWDWYSYLTLNLGNANRDAVTASVYARGALDIDGEGLGITGRSLSSLQDARDASADYRLNHAYLGFHQLIENGELRVGRQTLFDTPVLLHLDGAVLDAPGDFYGLPVHLSMYAGKPFHFWEASRTGEAAAGLAFSLTPWHRSQIRLDVMRINDVSFFGRPRNTLVGGQMTQVSADGQLWLSLGGTWLEGDWRDASLDGGWTLFDQDLQLNFFARSLRTKQGNETLEFDPFTAFLVDEQPYHEGQLTANYVFPWEPFNAPWLVLIGAYARTLKNQARVSEFNRDYERYWASTTFEEVPFADANLTLTVDTYDSGTDHTVTGGAELEWQVEAKNRLILGTSYSRYRFDFFTTRERFGVRDFYLRFRREISDAVRLRLNFSHQSDNIEDFQVVSMQLEWRF